MEWRVARTYVWTLTVLALIAAGFLVGGAASHPRRAAVGPSITPIEATFDDAKKTTFYDVSLREPAAATTDWDWVFDPPTDDAVCNKFEALTEETERSRAAWHHAESDGCHHTGKDHAGTVSVIAVTGLWRCTATIMGTLTHSGPSTDPCVKLPPPVTKGGSTPSDDKPQSTKDMYSRADNRLEALGARETGTGTIIAGLGASLFGWGVGTSATVVGVPAGVPLAVAGAGLVLVGSVLVYVGAEDTAKGKGYASMAVDPPDPHYAVVAKPGPIALGHLKVKAKGSPAVEKAVALANVYIDGNARLIALMRVIRTTADRASGAAKAKATAALARQRTAFVAYARQAAALIEKQQMARHALAAALAEAKITVVVSASGARKAADAFAKAGAARKKGSALSAFLLGRLGFNPAAVAKLQQQAITALRSSGGFSFPGILLDPAFDKNELATARVLRDWAAAVAKQR